MIQTSPFRFTFDWEAQHESQLKTILINRYAVLFTFGNVSASLISEGDAMKIVFKAGNIIEAHIVSGMLNACEINTYVGGHFLQGAVGDLSPAGFANVFVALEDFDQAAAIVEDYEKSSECTAPESLPQGLSII